MTLEQKRVLRIEDSHLRILGILGVSENWWCHSFTNFCTRKRGSNLAQAELIYVVDEVGPGSGGLGSSSSE